MLAVMNSRLSRYRRVIGAGAAAIVLLGGGIGIGIALTGGASATTGSTSAAGTGALHPCAHRVARRAAAHLPSARPAAAQCGRLHRLALGGGIHGQITFRAKTGFRTVAFERGSVRSVSGSALTVRAADGTTWIWHLVKSSVIRENGAKVAAGKLAGGEQVLVAGPVISGLNDVRLLRIRPAA